MPLWIGVLLAAGCGPGVERPADAPGSEALPGEGTTPPVVTAPPPMDAPTPPPMVAPAPPPLDAPPPPPVVVADGRQPRDPASVRDGAPERPALLQAAASAREHWNGVEPGWEEEFRVMDVAAGSFTRAGATQEAVLYLMSLWPRCCPKMGIAVVEDGALVRNVAFAGVAQALRGIPDLDGDGVDELALEGSFGMGGQTSTSVTVLALGPGDVVPWGSMSIMDSGCATGRDGSGAEAARVLASPGPAFVVERYLLSTCDDGGVWIAEGPPQPLELRVPGVEDESQVYVDLPVEGSR